jgi:ribonuclease HII
MKFDLNFESLPTPLIGVDEVGRGCLAGPVTAAAVIFRSEKDILLYQDSKKINESKREELALSIQSHHLVSIGWASVEEIDELNILQATFLAMKRAVQGLPNKEGTILVDGRDKIPNLVGFEQRAIVKGDQLVSIISAASIAAKVARDHFMKKIGTEFEKYGFDQHKGYGTEKHRLQIQKHGPTKWHRKSFGGVKEFV